MADFNQFGSAKPPQPVSAQHCAQCEAMLADALDGTLSPAEQTAFDLHMTMCPTCSDMLADAQRGVAWLEMLKSPRPEPSTDLVDRILAQTCNAVNLSPAQQASSAWQSNTLHTVSQPAASGKILPFRSRLASMLHSRSTGHTMLQPRLAMTAAMAFFSITLTMNLVGIHLTRLKLSDLKPSSIKRNFYEANAHVTRYYTNLKVVYELESRVRDLQRSNDNDNSYGTLPLQNGPTAAPAQQQTPGSQPQQKNHPTNQKQLRPKPGPGSSQRESSGNSMMLTNLSPSSPRQTPPPAHQSFIVFSPNTLRYLQEGELV